MSDAIGLLRAVNVGGQGAVPMAGLRAELTRRKFEEVRTVLQSGNLVFREPKSPGPKVERELEDAIDEAFVRSAAEWAEIRRHNPFPKEAVADPGHLILVCLKTVPAAPALAALRSAIRGRETVELRGRDLYAVYPDGMGTSRLTMAVLESKLGTRATARNWNTVAKIAALSGG
ncbi:MAG: DUF1697 domain-containing protein [Thermoplasmata archaeon]|nr:DUF1697 domain-containing protein [Thermoplasmata archaeon]